MTYLFCNASFELLQSVGHGSRLFWYGVWSLTGDQEFTGGIQDQHQDPVARPEFLGLGWLVVQVLLGLFGGFHIFPHQGKHMVNLFL